MHKELQDKLYTDFPELFGKLINDNDHIWCPDGWFDMIYNLSTDINNIRKSLLTITNSDYQVVQIKEKFSGLRYYMNGSTPEMNELIFQVENRSYNICGSCGNHKGPRKPTETLWGKNICDTCSMIKNIIE